MDSKSYTAWRDNFIASQLPYRIVEPQELISSGENTYLMHGLELEVEPNISEQMPLSAYRPDNRRLLPTPSEQMVFVIYETILLYRIAWRRLANSP